ncbi:MAG TPA: hypothetical protein DD979_01555 [Gammaproteobacteria bacterium]|nr:hypothetical protein [Gammaproteobacteria bacterium]
MPFKKYHKKQLFKLFSVGFAQAFCTCWVHCFEVLHDLGARRVRGKSVANYAQGDTMLHMSHF